MNYPDISPNFTIDDIHKIREWSYERRKNMTVEEFNKDLAECSSDFRRELQEIRDRKTKLPKSA
jgi:hypothetical protein